MIDDATQTLLDDVVKALRSELGDNLHSCCLYGSMVRGNAIKGVSDLNLLIVLNESTGAAHDAICRAIGTRANIDPFILGKASLARSYRAFTPKFVSIQRNYRVIHGADPLAGLTPDVQQEKFLCEQSLRNQRLRLVYSFVTRPRHRRYAAFVTKNVTSLFVRFAEVLRLEGIEVPVEFEARIPIFEKEMKLELGVLGELLALKGKSAGLSDAGVPGLHGKLIGVLDAALGWIETRWKA